MKTKAKVLLSKLSAFHFQSSIQRRHFWRTRIWPQAGWSQSWGHNYWSPCPSM